MHVKTYLNAWNARYVVFFIKTKAMPPVMQKVFRRNDVFITIYRHSPLQVPPGLRSYTRHVAVISHRFVCRIFIMLDSMCLSRVSNTFSLNRHYSTRPTITGYFESIAPLFRRRSKKKIKSPRHYPLWGESNGHRWIPLTNSIQNSLLPRKYNKYIQYTTYQQLIFMAMGTWHLLVYVCRNYMHTTISFIKV